MLLANKAAALLNGRLQHANVLSGGDLSTVLRVELTDGRSAIVKTGPKPRAEAAMLDALAAAGAPAPKILAINDEVLVIEVVPASGSINDAWFSLGQVLAVLHAATGTRYGWDEEYAFGSVTIENRWIDDWPHFWAERRLLTNLSYLPIALARRVETLASDLDNRLPAQPAAALLHGDLWSGNILVDHSRVSGLIDPACYYGHSEVDIAILGMFDRPGEAFYDGYGPLEPGSARRLAIYRLWPALVHLRLFNGHYPQLVDGLLSAVGV